jgi:uncharacterized protein (TIGR02271 family)
MDGYAIREGMVVYSADGQKLGKVVNRGAGYFTIEKGLIFKTDCEARDDEIARVDGEEIWLGTLRDDIVRRGALEREAETSAEPMAEAELRATGVTEETRVPLAEERLEVEKRARQAGEVRVEKEVITEQQQVSVPVTREEVRVERVPASGEQPSTGAAFTESETRIPITEEEVEIRKRPVVREEVRVSKTQYEEQRAASAEVRHEEAEIEAEGNVERREEGQPGRRSYDEDPNMRR